MATQKNPTVKKGDFIILLNSKNGISSSYFNTIFEVVSDVRISGNISTVTIRSMDDISNYTLYCKSDTYTLATKEAKLEIYKKDLAALTEEIKVIQDKIDFLENYESEEEFVAHKLEAILSAHGRNTSKKVKIAQMTAILKELKQSNLL